MGYQWGQPIVINHTKCGATNSTSFPLLVSGTYANLATVANGGLVTNASGYDIGFFADRALTQKLNWETVIYTAATGLVLYWVQVPTLSASVDTIIYLGYGNSAVSTDQSATAGTTWDANYKGVYHLEDNAANTTVADSSQNAKNLVCNVNTSTLSAAALVGNGFNIAGAAANRSSLADASLIAAGNGTLEAWVKPSATNVYQCLISNSVLTDGSHRNYGVYLSTNGTGQIYRAVGGGAGANVAVSPGWTNNAWNHIMLTADGTNIKLFINGVLANTTADTTVFGSSAGYTTFVGSEHNTADLPVTNLIDECRITLGLARSVDWALASYNNHNSPSAFFQLGGRYNTQDMPRVNTLRPHAFSPGQPGIKGWS